jgi:chemotaxis methyl-accepting protein methylase
MSRVLPTYRQSSSLSLTMLLLEMAPGRPHSILATDINDTILALAPSASSTAPLTSAK